MSGSLGMKTSNYSPEEYSRRLVKTFLGVPPSKGGLSVPELKTGLNHLLRSYKTIKKSRADSINCYRTAHLLRDVKVSTLKKKELLEHLKPYRRDINRIKVEIGIRPRDEMERKVLGLVKDPKLKYKACHYKAKEFTNERWYGRFHYYNTDTTELKKAITRIHSRREAHGIHQLPHELLDLVEIDAKKKIIKKTKKTTAKDRQSEEAVMKDIEKAKAKKKADAVTKAKREVEERGKKEEAEKRAKYAHSVLKMSHARGKGRIEIGMRTLLLDGSYNWNDIEIELKKIPGGLEAVMTNPSLKIWTNPCDASEDEISKLTPGWQKRFYEWREKYCPV